MNLNFAGPMAKGAYQRSAPSPKGSLPSKDVTLAASQIRAAFPLSHLQVQG